MVPFLAWFTENSQSHRQKLKISRGLIMNAAELFIICLENEGVEYISGISDEENLNAMDAIGITK